MCHWCWVCHRLTHASKFEVGFDILLPVACMSVYSDQQRENIVQQLLVAGLGLLSHVRILPKKLVKLSNQRKRCFHRRKTWTQSRGEQEQVRSEQGRMATRACRENNSIPYPLTGYANCIFWNSVPRFKQLEHAAARNRGSPSTSLV